jgi:hypothetical protein
MIDSILSWFGRVWITAVILAMFYLEFTEPSHEVWALFHIGWAPFFPIPNPTGVFRWIVTTIAAIIVALPGFGALLLRDKLRKKRRPN